MRLLTLSQVARRPKPQLRHTQESLPELQLLRKDLRRANLPSSELPSSELPPHDPATVRAKKLSKHRRKITWTAAAVVVIILGLMSLWRWSPLNAYVNPNFLRASLQTIKDSWWAPLVVVPSYSVASFLMFPNMVMDITTILSFGGFRGWLYAVLGSLSSATLFFFFGRRYAARAFRSFESDALQKIESILQKGGIGSIVAIRLLPIAPFPVVNLAAGALGLKYPTFITATFIAMAPGTISLALFGRQIRRVLVNPSLANILAMAAIVGGSLAVLYLAKRLATRKLHKNNP